MDGKKRLKKCLCECMRHMTVENIRQFVSLCGNVNKLYHKTTLLCEAARRGNLEAARALVTAGAKVDMIDAAGSSPLYLAASHGHVNLIHFFATKGANIDLRNKAGFTPLVSALQNSHSDCAKLLVDLGACVNTDRPTNVYGATVSLLTYVLFAKGDWAMAEILLRAGIRPTKFISPLGFVLLEDPAAPVDLIQKFVYAGFDVHVRGWAELVERRGEHLSEAQRHLVDFLEHERRNVPCLQRLCRTVVRTQLSQEHVSSTGSHMHIIKKIEMLPLPKEVQRYLKLEYL